MDIEVAPRTDKPAETPLNKVQRRAAIVAAARNVFLENGFGSATMNAIAARIGGSKTTLWTYFSSKELLFEAVVDDLVERYGSMIESVDLTFGDVPSTLRRFALSLLTVASSREVLALNRLVVAEAERFPDLGLSYFRKGPGRAQQRLVRFLTEASAEGLLGVAAPERAARHFLALCMGGIVQDMLMGMVVEVSPERLREEAADATATFCRAYGGEV